MPRRWKSGALILTVAFNAALATLSYLEYQVLLDQAEQSVQAQTATLADAVNGLTDRADRTLSGIGEVLNAAPDMQHHDNPAAHHLLLRRHGASPFLRSLFLVDAEGHLWALSSAANPKPIDVSDRDYF